MESQIIEILREKVKQINGRTKVERARKGAYVDCITIVLDIKKRTEENDKR